MKKTAFLMLKPDHFQVKYVINPWMTGNVDRAESETAADQWEALYSILNDKADLLLCDPRPGWPDMVFTANAALVYDNTALLAHFAHTQRRGEEPFFEKWFNNAGYEVVHTPAHLFFEGAGDALFDADGKRLWAGYGFRSSLEVHPFLADSFNIETHSLRLVDPRFYHLDTCFCPLPGGFLLYYPQALDMRSNNLIESLVPANKRIVLDESDAINFCANAVGAGNSIIIHSIGEKLRSKLTAEGFEVIETRLDEFMKAGGSAKCLTLRLNDAVYAQREVLCDVSTRSVEVEGQLIDSRLMGRVCDLIVNNAGSFQVKDINLGQKKEESSRATIDITAPTAKSLDQLIQKVALVGATLPEGEERDAKLEMVVADGVAPDNFCATTIYPTEVRVDGKWLKVENQRMDAVVVVEDGTARCELMRKLVTGQMVVTGGDGTRIVKRPDAHMDEGEAFGFMASSISSERKVELNIERVAWEMKRIRERGGKMVVVAGPVVAHTGGAAHLSWMIREGFVSAFLGGNAIAAHDIETAIYGTSLGVDMKTGKPVEGGHRNHLYAINQIRKAGSIRAAVQNGVLREGLFYELIKKDIPVSLAGSIRDDGPLPETKMNLLEAQADYARHIKGADLILMLSTMLHSIGAGNMTPAGVHLVCVDINPAVVTKLADRGSLESVGIVTDVGLFLSLLKERLSS